MKRTIIAALALGVTGCPEVKPPTTAPSPKPVAPAASPSSTAGPRPAADPATDPTTLTRSWSVQTPPFLRGLAMTDAHVVVQSRTALAVLDRRGGKVLAQRETCEAPRDAVAATDEGVWLMCPEGLQAFELPKLVPGVHHELASPGRIVAFSRDRALVASDDGLVRDIELTTGAPTRSFAVGETPEALAAGPEGTFAAGRVGGDVVVYAPDGRAARVGAPTGFGVVSLRYAPDHRHLLVSAGPSLAVWQVGPEAPEEPLRFSGVREVVGARWLGPHQVATVGPDGVLVLDVRTQAVAALAGDPGGEELVAVAARGRDALCAGDRNGRVTCWAKGRPRNVAPTDAAPGARCTGTVTSLERRVLVVEAEPGAPLPEERAKVTIRRFARTTAKKRQNSVWLEVAHGRVLSVEDAKISLQLTGPVGFAPVEGPVLDEGVVVELRWRP